MYYSLFCNFGITSKLNVKPNTPGCLPAPQGTGHHPGQPAVACPAHRAPSTLVGFQFSQHQFPPPTPGPAPPAASVWNSLPLLSSQGHGNCHFLRWPLTPTYYRSILPFHSRLDVSFTALVTVCKRPCLVSTCSRGLKAPQSQGSCLSPECVPHPCSWAWHTAGT